MGAIQMAMDLYSLLAEMELAERMGLNANQFDKIVFAKWANSVEARHNVVSSHNTSANHSLAVGESLVVPTSKIYVNYYIDYERDYAPDKYFVYGLQISNSGVVCSAYDLLMRGIIGNTQLHLECGLYLPLI